MKIVETDNFNGDYPDETFLNLPCMHEGKARRIAECINRCMGTDYHRYWMVVDNDYKLRPGFEP